MVVLQNFAIYNAYFDVYAKTETVLKSLNSTYISPLSEKKRNEMEIVQATGDPQTSPVKRQKRKDDARDLALLIYDIYKDRNENDNVINGQNNANHNNEPV